MLDSESHEGGVAVESVSWRSAFVKRKPDAERRKLQQPRLPGSGPARPVRGHPGGRPER